MINWEQKYYDDDYETVKGERYEKEELSKGLEQREKYRTLAVIERLSNERKGISRSRFSLIYPIIFSAHTHFCLVTLHVMTLKRPLVDWLDIQFTHLDIYARAGGDVGRTKPRRGLAFVFLWCLKLWVGNERE